MSIANDQSAAGISLELQVSAEPVTIGDLVVAAVINEDPLGFEMMDSGYLNKQPISFEVLKGTTDSLDTIEIEGIPTAMDLRGVVPTLRMAFDYNGAKRSIVKINDAGSRWILSTIRKAVA